MNYDLDSWQGRLKIETLELAEKVNKLHTYMATDAFYQLPREDKDLLYKQEKFMMGYLQILGKRCELHGIKLGGESDEEITDSTNHITSLPDAKLHT